MWVRSSHQPSTTIGTSSHFFAAEHAETAEFFVSIFRSAVSAISAVNRVFNYQIKPA